MANDKIPDHIKNLRANVSEVKRLLEIHRKLTGDGPGRRYDVQVLNKSAVLLVVATWEYFVESLVLTGVNFMAAQSTSIDQLPSSLRSAVATKLEKDAHDHAVWRLSGDGWRQEIIKEAQARITALNTPKATNVDNIVSCIFGIENLSSNWCWKGASAENVQRRLSSLLNLRHEIAHGVEASRSVTRQYVEQSNTLVIRLAAISSNRVRTKLHQSQKKYPWEIYVKGVAK